MTTSTSNDADITDGFAAVGTSPADALMEVVKTELGVDASRWFTPEGYDSVSLAVLDSIYSTGNHYTSVVNALNAYREARRGEGADPDRDTATDLVEATDRWGGVEGLVERTSRCRAWASTSAPFKADAAYGAARLLAEHGLNTRDEVRAALSDPAAQEESPVKKAWRGLPGQSSLLTWTYFLMLCGVPGVKADRMVVAYVSRALGREVSAREAAAVVGEVADRIGVDRTKLDHAIWRKESGREVYLDGGAS